MFDSQHRPNQSSYAEPVIRVRRYPNATVSLKGLRVVTIALIFDTVLFQKIIGDRRRHTSHQGIVKELCSFHRKAMSVTFEVINI